MKNCFYNTVDLPSDNCLLQLGHIFLQRFLEQTVQSEKKENIIVIKVKKEINKTVFK